MSNILLAPTHKISERRAILFRTLDALLADPDCRYDFWGLYKVSADEEVNWQARETICGIIRTFPSEKIRDTNNSPPEVESPRGETTDDASEPSLLT